MGETRDNETVPSFDVHCRDCERILGDRHEKVNRWLDELFQVKGPGHRRLRHHIHGIELAQQLFGIEGAKAAIVHIVRDCGHVPSDSDYVSDPCFVDDDAAWAFTNDVSEDLWQQFRRKVHDEWSRLLSRDLMKAADEPLLRCLHCGWVHVGCPEPAPENCFRCGRLAFEIIDEEELRRSVPLGVTLQGLRWPPPARTVKNSL